VQSYDQSLDFGLIADAAAVPDVKMLADALAIAFDDIRALPLPHEHDEENDCPAPTLVGRAAKGITGAVSGAVKGAMRGAMNTAAGNVLPKMAKGLVDVAIGQAVAQVTRKSTAAAPAKRVRPR
jgi:diacylglycerol O-acyltransferase / wax synthase